ncbi:hypothetical protein Tco_0849221 [Tanacetum coccineum]
MSNSKCPELARRFSDQVPRTVTKMMQRVDDFIKSEEVYRSTELSKGEFPERGQGASYRGSRPPRSAYRGGQQRRDNCHNFNSHRDHYQPYVPSRTNNQRYNNRRHENNHLSLDALTKRSKEILTTELQLQLSPYPPMAALELGKLSHLVKYVKQRGNARGRQQGNNNGKGKVINMVWSRGDNRKHKSRTAEKRGVAIQVMFEHCFDNLPPSVKERLTPTQTELVAQKRGVLGTEKSNAVRKEVEK